MNHLRRHWGRIVLPVILCGIYASTSGCGAGSKCPPPPGAPIPFEKHMTTLPTYVIEPPDILLITTMSVVPKPPYHIKPLDSLAIQVSGTVKEKEIYGLYPIEPGGTVNLGLGFGAVQVAGLTIEEAQQKVQDHLGKILKNATVQVSLGQSRAMMQISGPHLVRQDGTISMGLYGSLYITNMTLEQAKQAIEEHLSTYVLKPEIALDVYVYNSKWYYIIMDRAGFGQTVIRLPITGRDTVLDALSTMGGTFSSSSDRYMWLARPNAANPDKYQMFPINWPALTQGGSPSTNYQLMPGDRLYVQSNPLIKANTRISQFWAPIMSEFNNLFGLTVLGTSTVSAVAGTAELLRGSGATGAILPGGVGTVGIVGR